MMNERVVQQYRVEIVRCIKEPKIVSLLEGTILSPDDAKKLRSDYQHHPNLWVENLLDLIVESNAQGKWTAFSEALKNADYPYLLRLLRGEDVQTDDGYVAKIGLHRPLLEESLRLGDVLCELHSKDVINMVDRQEIDALNTNKGNQHAVTLLLDRIQCRLDPAEWYYRFLDTLQEKQYENELLHIEPDFLKYRATRKFSTNTSGVTQPCEPCSSSMDVDDSAQSVKEHILTDYAEADISMNNLSPAPALSIKKESLEDNLKPLNIKPEINKPLIIDDVSLTDVKGEKNTGVVVKKEEPKEEPKEEGNPLLDSDYEDDDEDEGLFKLQNFQLELAEKAVAGINTVVCAPTGTGKTWVAFYIIQQHLRAAKQGETRKVVFTAKTGALIKQQSDRLKKYLPEFQTKLLQGDGDEGGMLGEFLQDYDILCFTPQILVNNLDNGSVKSMSQFSLIIFDECHHTKGDSPYSNLMRKYLFEKWNKTEKPKLPQIVGLTATLGVGKSSTDVDALDYIHHIFALLDVTEISTVERETEEMLKQTSAPEEKMIRMQIRENDPCKSILLRAIDDTERMLEEMAIMQPSLVELMVEKRPPNKESQEYSKWAHDVQKAAMHNVNDLFTTRNIQACANYLITYNEALEVNSLLQTVDVIKYMAEKHRQDIEQKEKLTTEEQTLLKELIGVQTRLTKQARDNENPNVRQLCTILRQMLENGGEESRAMVFVKARATCKALASFLARNLNDIVVTKPLYGKETRGHEEGMTQAVQDDTVQKFRDGIYKVLVATSIGVEGIDIPECNMSLNYNFIGNEVTKVQMRGRIRKRGGVNVTMIREKDLDKEKMSAYREAMMLRAMEMFKKQKKIDVERKIKLYQKEEIYKARFRQETDLYKKRRKTDEGDYEIRCKRCNTLACYISDVRTIKCQHFVIDKDFVDRINVKPHKSPKEYDGFNKNRKMFCKKCPLDWGIIAVKDGLDCRILKLECFKLINMETRDVTLYKKWDDVPYRVPEINVDDLPRLLGEKQNDIPNA